MKSAPVNYDKARIEDLLESTQYESWLLEAIYDIVESPIFVDWPDQLVYPASGEEPELRNFLGGNIVLGDWRPRFIEVGAPLVFVTSFKLIDMLVEWMLRANGITPPFQYAGKIALVRKGLTLPEFLFARVWLWDRVIGLYVSLAPFRGTIIHARNFKTSNGALYVSSSKAPVVGLEVTITADELRGLAVFAVSLLRYLDGSWPITAFKEKYLRCSLDGMAHLHGCPSLGQKVPRFLVVRVFSRQQDPITIDLQRIRDDLTTKFPAEDVVFDLRIVAVNSEGNKANGYLLPWEVINRGQTHLVKSMDDLACFEAPVPKDIDIRRTAQELESNNR